MNSASIGLLMSLKELEDYEGNRHRVVSTLAGFMQTHGRVVLVSCGFAEYDSVDNTPEYRVAFENAPDTETVGATFDEAVLALIKVTRLKQIAKGR